MLFHAELIYLLKITDKNKIMILTGKTEEDFFNWLDNQGANGIDISNWEFEKFHLLSNVSKNSLIIEWFDSVGICIDRDCINMEMVITNFRGINEEQTIIDCDHKETFKDWWEEAIKKANEIYNGL